MERQQLEDMAVHLERTHSSPASFTCVGEVINGKFVPSHIEIHVATLEEQERIQAFLATLGLKNGDDIG